MLFIVSDNDMQNRYEQTELMISTLRHFEYDMSKISLRVMHGKHCRYDKEPADDGNTVFSHIAADYIMSL